MSWWRTIVGTKQQRRLARYERKVAAVSRLEAELKVLSDEAISQRAAALRDQAAGGASLDDLLVEAFALCREASTRTLGMRHYDVQLMGGMALHQGLIVEMKTGEGKTLVATLAAALNALTGAGVHLVTVNDYLAQRDAQWMGPLYNMLGLSVGVVLEQPGDDRDQELRARQAAYGSDITYGTNHEIAFDFLRDNLATTPDEVVQRGFAYAIIDEVDFLIIDEARTPLIISGPSREDTGIFDRVDRVTRSLNAGYHYMVEPKTRRANLTDAGFRAVEQALGLTSLVDPANLDLFHAVHQSVLAHGVFQRDVDYIVEQDGQVLIVDEFTGRVSSDKRYSDGLHQAIEAKERVTVKAEDRTLAKVTYQTFYGRYHKLAGMTGTAYSEREEFQQTYGRDVQVIPTHKPMVREDFEDLVFDRLDHKHQAMVDEIVELSGQGRPVLVGSTSVRESEQLSGRLKQQGLAHAVLNAKNHQAEAEIIAQAGRQGAVTISTNMAGRGTDIVLGGDPARHRDAIVAAGGLHVIGTAHHESARIDDQLRGRAGRQGDPGSSQFMVSLDDAIWQKFGRLEISDLRDALAAQDRAEDQPLEGGRVRRLLRSLQDKVDQENKAIRKDVLKYDLVIHAQRETIYGWRRTLVSGEGYDPQEVVRDVVQDLAEDAEDLDQLAALLQDIFGDNLELAEDYRLDPIPHATDAALALLQSREQQLGAEAVRELGRQVLLGSIDELWTEHLSALDRAEEGIGLRGYAQIDPVLEWRREATEMWQELLVMIRTRAVRLWFALELWPDGEPEPGPDADPRPPPGQQPTSHRHRGSRR